MGQDSGIGNSNAKDFLIKQQLYFSKNEREYLLYQKRLDAERVENTWKHELTRLTNEVTQAKRREDQERREKEEAKRREDQERKEKERLLELLKRAGIDPTPADPKR